MSDGTHEGYIYDHTLGNAAGYFLYTAEHASESSGPAVMVTEPLHNSFLECTMEFWYSLLKKFQYFLFITAKESVYLNSIPGLEEVQPCLYMLYEC